MQNRPVEARCLKSFDPVTMFEIRIEDTDDVFSCKGDKNVLKAMEQLGRKGIPVGCRGGGCGVCKVQVIGESSYHTGKMSREHVSEADEKEGICLACKLFPESDLRLKVMGKWKKEFVADTFFKQTKQAVE